MNKASFPEGFSYGLLGTRCTTTSNYVVQFGFLAIYSDDKLITTTADFTTKYKITDGFCLTDYTLLWNVSEAKSICHFQSLGEQEVFATSLSVLVPDLEASFTFNNYSGFFGECSLSEVHWMDNNFIVIFNNPRVSGDFREWIKSHPVEIGRMDWLHLTRTDPSSMMLTVRHVNRMQEYTTILANSLQSSEASHDPTNAKLQFVYELLKDQINEQFRTVWRSICELTNALIINAKAAPPTVAARMLPQREDVCAILRDTNLLLIYPCNEKGIESYDDFSSRNILAIQHQTFKAGALPSIEKERISLALFMLSAEMRRFKEGSTISSGIRKSEIDSLRDEGERLLWETEREIGVATHEIQEVLDDVSGVAIKTTITVSIFIALGIGAVLACRCQIKRRTKQVKVQLRLPEMEDTGAELQKTTRGHTIPQKTLQEVQFLERAESKREMIFFPLRRSIFRKTRTMRTMKIARGECREEANAEHSEDSVVG